MGKTTFSSLRSFVNVGGRIVQSESLLDSYKEALFNIDGVKLIEKHSDSCAEKEVN
jgi:hypothetical protein